MAAQQVVVLMVLVATGCDAGSCHKCNRSGLLARNVVQYMQLAGLEVVVAEA